MAFKILLLTMDVYTNARKTYLHKRTPHSLVVIRPRLCRAAALSCATGSRGGSKSRPAARVMTEPITKQKRSSAWAEMFKIESGKGGGGNDGDADHKAKVVVIFSKLWP
jgi:hypothetical protein